MAEISHSSVKNIPINTFKIPCTKLCSFIQLQNHKSPRQPVLASHTFSDMKDMRGCRFY